MLFVLFQLGKNRYALEAGCVVEVLPLLELKHVPQPPRGVAGIFVYRGQPVPALDLCELTLGRPALEHLSTRIIIIRHRKSTGESQLIGLIAERATGTLRRDEKAFVDAGGVKLASAPFVGPILMDDQGVIQLLDAQKLLDEGEQKLRLTHSVGASHAPH
jgi:chemotaxis-related protein WspB